MPGQLREGTNNSAPAQGQDADHNSPKTNVTDEVPL